LPGPARADGLLYQLPPDGSWVRYDIEGKVIDADGKQSMSVAGSVTMSSVGRETVDNEPCRWIEIATRGKIKRGDKESEHTETIKFLIPEKDLKRGVNPLDTAKKAIRKRDGQVKEVDVKTIAPTLEELFHAPPQEVKKGDSQIIENKLGKLNCERWTGRHTKAQGQFETAATIETSVNPAAPFGVVAYEFQRERKRNGEALGKQITIFKLADVGKDARSELKEGI
jgi:hypothetical protein